MGGGGPYLCGGPSSVQPSRALMLFCSQSSRTLQPSTQILNLSPVMDGGDGEEEAKQAVATELPSLN